ncbi:hypothetical protein [Ketogulonicigenium vulgare]|uniref:hypothetical protein n=1 Tax=Ketogulonicigenium vulgare TaxID=92945 RepID=UPI00235873C8|nr:hypothetical protein [Ketogulonicigenium vulgare]
MLDAQYRETRDFQTPVEACVSVVAHWRFQSYMIGSPAYLEGVEVAGAYFTADEARARFSSDFMDEIEDEIAKAETAA